MENKSIDEQVEILFLSAIQKSTRTLTSTQKVKLKLACQKTILDNPDLSLLDWCQAANLYLNLILEFPDLEL